MASTSPTTLEYEIRSLLEETRREAHRYASAHYREPGTPGKSGLNMRLEAIEAALIKLAAAVDIR
jgi:hypothetical protein